MASQKLTRSERFLLKGSLKRNGFDRWRLVINGISVSTGEERAFFVEIYTVNPGLSPKECVLGFKTRQLAGESDLQYALAGTEAAQTMQSESYVQPSFVQIKAGMLGEGGKQIHAYFPYSEVQAASGDIIFNVGNPNMEFCSLTASSCAGSVCVLSKDLTEKPELLGQAGRMSWNVKYKKRIGFLPDYNDKEIHWAALGVSTDFDGSIVFDDEEFSVTRARCFGYMDRLWGEKFATPFFHLSASNFVSIINGKHLEKSCFAVQGLYNGTLSVLVSIEGMNVEFHAAKGKSYSLSYDCSEMPEDEDGAKLHWSVSVNNRHYVVDIDVYCPASALFLRDYECPEGKRELLRVLGGGTGTGEVRVYHKIKKNLELLEHVRVANVVCDFGNTETPSL